MKYGNIRHQGGNLPIANEALEVMSAKIKKYFSPDKIRGITFRKGMAGANKIFAPESCFWDVYIARKNIPFTDPQNGKAGIKMDVECATIKLDLAQYEGGVSQYIVCMYTNGYCHFPRKHKKREMRDSSHYDWPYVRDYDTDISAFDKTLQDFAKDVL